MSDNGLAEFDARNAGVDAFAPTAPAPRQPAGQATQIEQARAIAEVRAAVMIAMDRPRDRTGAIAEMREVCSIPALAERAFFRVPRGREHVNGESIHLARELARCWGNIDYGVKELARDDMRGQSELIAFAWDLQTNARSEITFIVPHVRGRENKRLTGTQEIYENNASFAGRRLREAIFAVLPVWFKAEAADICHQTLANGGGKPLVQRIADLRLAFQDIGVTVAQLELKRGRKIDDFLPEDVAGLRVVYGSLKRGEVTIAEEFPSGEQPPPQQPNGSRLDALESASIDHQNTPAGTPQPQPQERATGGQDGAVPNHSDQSPAGAAGSERNAAMPQQVGPLDAGDRAESPPEASRGDEVHRPPAAAHDLLGGEPAENLTVPLGRNPNAADLEYFARQVRAEIDEKPRTAQRIAQIKMANSGGLAKLKAALPDAYDELQRELAR